MKLKYARIFEMFSAIGELDGRARVIRQNNQDVIGPPEPYNLKSDVQLVLAVNRNRLREHVEALAALERKAIAKSNEAMAALGEDGSASASAGVNWDHQEAVAALRDTEADVKLTKVALTDLKLDENKIPPSVIGRLLPMLKFDEPKVDEDGEAA